MLGLLKNRNYFRFWSAQIISQLGDGVTRLAIIYLVAMLSKDPLEIGLVIFAQLLPTAVFGIFFGPLADKYSRKWLMVGSDFYRMTIVLLMIFFHDSVPALITLIVFQGLGTAVFNPARSASIPDLVGEKNIQQAISLSQGTKAAMDIIGPSIGGLLLLMNNYTAIFLIDAATFLLSAFLLLQITLSATIHKHEQPGGEGYFSSIGSGIKQVVSMPALRFLLLLLMPVTLVVGALNTNLVAVLTNVFKVSPAHFGLLEASVGVGAIVGALFIGPYLLKLLRPSTVMLMGTIIVGAWMVIVIPLDMIRPALGITPIYLWCLMIGVLNTLINVPLSSLFLGATPAFFRGRGQALLGATANSFQLIGILAGGWIAGYIGVLNGTALSGLLLIIAVVFFPLLKGYKELHAIDPKNKKKPIKATEEKAGLPAAK
ncbi:MFS transporter [Pseudalkalibacillus caeni]|uniref:MFS transporter n=1 Tax=Exobacillus caeni TaxID=2574798 RepID=A0A5R9F8J8_9BACL|nr:MFS transporter [Pseudalkalibacillus caeni]TLS36045.1 MFS transporter [Pseudalkalibacillus caeni]